MNKLLANLTVAEMAHQLHLAFADDAIGPLSHNELYDSYVGNQGIGVIHDWFVVLPPRICTVILS